jgi:hypothetical protein
LDFNEIKNKFLSFLRQTKDALDSECDDIDESAYSQTVAHFSSQFENDYGKSEDSNDEDSIKHESFENNSELIYPEGSREYFQQSILGYRNKFNNLLDNDYFVAASNYVRGARQSLIQKLPNLLDELKSNLKDLQKQSKITDDCFETLYLFQKKIPEMKLFTCSEIDSIKKIAKINRQISEAKDLEEVLLDSLQSHPDN